MLSRSSTLQNIWINRASHRTMAALWRHGESLRDLLSLEEQNEELIRRNAGLELELEKYRLAEASEAEKDNVAGRESDPFRYIPATVVKMGRNTAHNHIIINKGWEDGVRPQSGIISAYGVVGIIDAVDAHFSYGLTLMNPNISVSARIKRTGYLAPLVWDGRHSDGAYLNDVALHHTVEPGDTVVTSGYSSIFPPDVPIGVAGESVMIDGSVMKTKVRLLQDFSTVKYVTVAVNMDRAEISALEEKEGI